MAHKTFSGKFRVFEKAVKFSELSEMEMYCRPGIYGKKTGGQELIMGPSVYVKVNESRGESIDGGIGRNMLPDDEVHLVRFQGIDKLVG